jgi:hypothetical protein
MFNNKLKQRVGWLESDVARVQKNVSADIAVWVAKLAKMESDFRLLLGALNMEVRDTEQFLVPRHIVKRPEPVTMACNLGTMPVPESYKDGSAAYGPPKKAAKRRRRKGGSK